MPIKAGILTVSDRAFRGAYPDRGGPALAGAVRQQPWELVAQAVVPDDRAAIQRAIREQMLAGCQLILTTGGTGIGPRDVTPEAVREMGGRELPGFGETMRRESLKITPHANLSRGLAVALERTLVICLPGKPEGALECLGFVAESIPHCLRLLSGDADHPA